MLPELLGNKQPKRPFLYLWSFYLGTGDGVCGSPTPRSVLKSDGQNMRTHSNSWANLFRCNEQIQTKGSAKALDCVDHNKLWEILKEMGETFPSSQKVLLDTVALEPDLRLNHVPVHQQRSGLCLMLCLELLFLCFTRKQRVSSLMKVCS